MLFLTELTNESTFPMEPSNQTALSTRVPPRSVAATVITMATICFLLGVFGNSRVLLQLYKRRDLRKVPHYLFASLSLTGLLAASVNMPSFIFFSVVYYLLNRRFSIELLCKTGKIFSLTVSILNGLTLSAMAIDREDRFIRPFTQRLTPTNVKKAIFIIWMVAAVLTVFAAVIVSQENSTCFAMDPYVSLTTDPNKAAKLFPVGIGTLFNTATFLVITITFFRVFKKLRSSVVPQAANTLSQQTGRQITRLTYQLCAVFIVVWLPLTMVNVVGRVCYVDSVILGTLRLFMIVMSNFNYAINPFLHLRMLRTRRRIDILSQPVRAT